MANAMNSSKKPCRGGKTIWSQRSAIVVFLEDPTSFNLITGNATANLHGVVAGAKVTKEAAYADLRDAVNSKCGTNWTSAMAKSRYRAYLKQYKDTKRNLINDRGKKYGLGEADFKKGITTIEAKLEDECPLFHRMDKLFGSRQNINPFNVMEGSLPEENSPVVEYSVDAVGDDNDDDDDDDDDSESEEHDDLIVGLSNGLNSDATPVIDVTPVISSTLYGAAGVISSSTSSHSSLCWVLKKLCRMRQVTIH